MLQSDLYGNVVEYYQRSQHTRKINEKVSITERWKIMIMQHITYISHREAVYNCFYPKWGFFNPSFSGVQMYLRIECMDHCTLDDLVQCINFRNYPVLELSSV